MLADHPSDMTLRLVHRTNYWGQYIDPSDTDEDVHFDAIWVQAMIDGDQCCCRGFGRRGVAVSDEDLTDEYDGWWSLFYVTGRYGRSDDHFFYKFVLIPQGTYGYGKRGCAQRGWRYEGEVHSSSACDGLDKILRYDYFYDQSNDIIHAHIGIMMDRPLLAGHGNSG